MRMLILGILLSVCVNTVSMAGDDDRRAKAMDKQRKKADKRQKELVQRTVKSHEHVMEYKRKSKTEDKKTARKTKRNYRKLDNQNDEIVKANKHNYSTKYAKNEFETKDAPADGSEGADRKIKGKRHIKRRDRGNTTFNNPESVVSQSKY
jgi:hypothetical protein